MTLSKGRKCSDEALRILEAARDGRLEQNDAGRYLIVGEPRPDFKTRKHLEQRGLISYRFRFEAPVNGSDRAAYKITRAGLDLLDMAEAERADECA